MFELVLFSTVLPFIQEAVRAGVQTILVDWEWRGKNQRQKSMDTQINGDTVDDLRRVSASSCANIICRINRHTLLRVDEIEQAIDAGADEILLPMVSSAEEVELVLDIVAQRCGVGIMLETSAAVENAHELAQLPLSRAYVGLNDLAIERATPNIFTAVVDGTVEHVRSFFKIPFGFAGLTLPTKGWPIPCSLIIAELARLECDFSFLRRSFHRDIKDANINDEIPRLLATLNQATQRSAERVREDRAALEHGIITRPCSIMKA